MKPKKLGGGILIEQIKFQSLKDLKFQYKDCTRCDLCVDRASVVFGKGNPNAKILVVGEAPGLDEDSYGVPFYGTSGAYLTSLMAKAWPADDKAFAEISKLRDDTAFIEAASEYFEDMCFYTNAVMCKPKREVDPKKSEIDACRSRLLQIIYTVDPDIIIACGAVAASAVVGKLIKIKKHLGKLLDVPVESHVSGNLIRYGCKVIYSPGYLLARGDQALVAKQKGDSYKTVVHLQEALEALDLMHKHQTGKHFWENK